MPISSPPPKQQNPPKSLKDLQIEQQNLLEKYSTYRAQLHEHERQAELKNWNYWKYRKKKKVNVKKLYLMDHKIFTNKHIYKRKRIKSIEYSIVTT